MQKLALHGGPKTVTVDDPELVRWPVVGDAEREAVLRVLASGRFTSNNVDGEVQLLEREWAAFVGTRHCVAVSNGTAALELAVAALEIEPGSEIVVPALSFVASAVAPLLRLCVPVFADVDPVTFNLDPAAVEAAITPRTRAIVAVHLHGLPAEIDELGAIAQRHGLMLIEDAAQAHGARYRGRRAGALADVAAFSLNVTKNLPTCGEGGLITTDRGDVAERATIMRQFGEVLAGGRPRDYVSRVLAGNEKLSAIQAAFTRAQLDRLDGAIDAREANVRAFLGRLAELPGLRVPSCPPDRTHAWHMLRFRFVPGELDLADVRPGALRAVVHRALRAEGVPLLPYQVVPLPGQPLFQTQDGFGGGYPWALADGPEPRYRIEDYPSALAVIESSLTFQRWHLNPASEPVLQRCADAFEKVWEQLDALLPIVRATTWTPDWERSLALAGT
jgi:dTDP-4-amino-4,6-dideoxygalactose transaminase